MAIKKGKLKIKKPDLSNTKYVVGHYDPYKDFMMDSTGYFLIRINSKKKKLEAAHCSELNKVDLVITGKTPQEVYCETVRRDLIGNFQHACYLGKELQRAYECLKSGKTYVQDE